MTLRTLPDPDYLPALDRDRACKELASSLAPNTHAPRILLLYGSLRASVENLLATLIGASRDPRTP